MALSLVVAPGRPFVDLFIPLGDSEKPVDRVIREAAPCHRMMAHQPSEWRLFAPEPQESVIVLHACCRGVLE